MKRKEFLKSLPVVGSAVSLVLGTTTGKSNVHQLPPDGQNPGSPIVLSTWDFQLPVNQTALQTLEGGGNILDAVERSIALVEEDPKITSVGRGGYPDRDGHLTLDACIMDEKGNAGAVLCLEHIMHPISVARKVMEKTPHVMLVGDGALQFAIEQGFPKENLGTDGAKKAYNNWLKKSGYRPIPDQINHDTIGLIAMDKNGNIAVKSLDLPY